jgi:hypothetical protein
MSMHYLKFLRRVHELLRPETYLEIGLRNGNSLALASCPAVGIDPAYNLTAELDGQVALFRTTSDEFFARPEPLAATGGRPFDLAFIDGLHLFEYSLRDFIHAERHARRGSVVIFDDVLPPSPDAAARERHTRAWTGDVFKIGPVLARHRPDLTVVTVDTRPTGLMLVMGLDPDNTVLTDNYEQILAEFRTPDPQAVPLAILRREHVLDPEQVLDSALFAALRDARSNADAGELGPVLRAALEEVSDESTAGVLAAPAPTISAEVAAGLRAAEFRSDAAWIIETADGARLNLPVLGLLLDHAIEGDVHLGPLAVPARLVPGDPSPVIQVWLSGLPGEYPLAIRFGGVTRPCGVHLVVGPAGQFDLIPAQVAASSGGSWVRRAARRVPGLPRLVRAARTARAG